jgi:outer membrane protein OmpA-like peptidoglycan-associated protein
VGAVSRSGSLGITRGLGDNPHLPSRNPNGFHVSSPHASPALLLVLVAPLVSAQAPVPAPAAGSAPVDLRYVGSNIRVGLGYDTENKARGDAFFVFGEDARSAWIGELWAAQHSAAGAQLSYHWHPADGTREGGVRKVFAAFDQSDAHDRKVTLGAGYESPSWFGSLYGSSGVTGRRRTGDDLVTTVSTITGSDGGRPYEQDILTVTRTQTWERAYDWGVGARAGHFYEKALLRLEAGADYEWGRASSRQGTLSLGVEKFFEGSPVSIALVGDVYRQTGDFQASRNDARLTAMVRYSFGGPAFRPAREYRTVKVEIPAPPPLATAATTAPTEVPKPRVEKRLVKTTASATADAFFDLDSARLRPEAKAALDDAIGRIRASGFEGNIRIAGNTCNLGTAAHNQKLSERRAEAVRAYMVAGGLPADRLLAVGLGMTNPRFPNDAAGRPKNRRVDIEFVTVAQKEEEVVVASAPAAAPAPAPAPREPRVEWRQEPIDTEPAWLRRALRNPASHKQYVDTYRTVETSATVKAGEKRYLNRAPVAANDAFTVNADAAGVLLDVLANDADPDGDALRIISVTAPVHGAATASGTKVAYTPQAGYIGPDSFTYTIADASGATSTASVAVTVVKPNHAPVATDDFAVAGFNQPVTIDVLANDSDPDGDALTLTSFTQPANGTVTRSGDKLVYLSKLNYIGLDRFTYTVSDGKGGTATAAVTVFADP